MGISLFNRWPTRSPNEFDISDPIRRNSIRVRHVHSAESEMKSDSHVARHSVFNTEMAKIKEKCSCPIIQRDRPKFFFYLINDSLAYTIIFALANRCVRAHGAILCTWWLTFSCFYLQMGYAKSQCLFFPNRFTLSKTPAPIAPMIIMLLSSRSSLQSWKRSFTTSNRKCNQKKRQKQVNLQPHRVEFHEPCFVWIIAGEM